MPPVSCPDIDSTATFALSSRIIPFMSPKRWSFFLLSIIVGIGIGLYYGWVLSPVQYVDTTPPTLRVDFRTDYTLMVAETYQAGGTLDNAARQLAILGSQPPAQIVTSALIFAQQHQYAPADISLLQNLSVALQVWKPGGDANPLPTNSNPADILTTPLTQPGVNQP